MDTKGQAMGAWQASVARNRLSEIIDQAVAGDPQFIERRDGKEVVVVSRDYFERTKGNLKTFLLNETYAGSGEEEFDAIMENVRPGAASVFSPRQGTDLRQGTKMPRQTRAR